MSGLVLIWASAAGLTALAVAWMAVLILLRVVRDRRSIAEALDRRQLQAALVALMGGAPEARARLAPYIGRPRLLAEVLLDFLALVSGGDRQNVIAGLHELGAEAAFRRGLGRGCLADRLACADVLGAFRAPETLHALRRRTGRGPERIRLAALRSLAAAGGGAAVATVLDELRRGKLRPSGLLAEVLRGLVVADPEEAIAACAVRDLTPAARVLLLDALGEAGDYRALTVLAEQTQWPQSDVRVAAVRALGRLKHPAAEPQLRQALDDPCAEVRGTACEAIGAARLPRLADALLERLRDPAWLVRFQAASALSKLGPPGLQVLHEAAESPMEVVSRAASLTLAEIAA